MHNHTWTFGVDSSQRLYAKCKCKAVIHEDTPGFREIWKARPSKTRKAEARC